MKNLAEHIKDLENTRAASIARMEELTSKSVEAGRSFDEAEVEEFDGIEADLKQIDEDLVRYKSLLARQASTATPPTPQVRTVDAPGNRQAPAIISQPEAEEKFEGQNFTRMVIAKALGRLSDVSPIRIAEERWGKTNPRLVEVIKADVAGIGSGSGDAGAELVVSDSWMGDFINYLYAKTVYNQLPLREVPANVTIGQQDGANTGYWVGENKAIPVSVADYNAVSLSPLKVAALAVASKEWLRDSQWSAEQLVRDSLVESAAQRIDATFISNSAAVAGTTPAGILNNIASTLSAGTDGDAVANDLKELMYRFTAANNSAGLIVLIMNPSLATGLQLMRNALDQYEFPNVSRDGGTVLEFPVFTGDNVNANRLIMLKPSDIYRIGAGSIEVSLSDQASIEMANNPAQDSEAPTAATGKVVNMFQTESIAFKVVLPINFQRRRESAVAWISDADYGAAIST